MNVSGTEETVVWNMLKSAEESGKLQMRYVTTEKILMRTCKALGLIATINIACTTHLPAAVRSHWNSSPLLATPR